MGTFPRESIPKYSYIMNDYFLIPGNLMLAPLD